jgi:hypothetical protein
VREFSLEQENIAACRPEFSTRNYAPVPLCVSKSRHCYFLLSINVDNG